MDRTAREELHREMVRLADGDRSAFDPVFRTLWPVLRRFAERALPGSADSEDVAQSALVKIFSRASDLDPARDALSWVLGIVAYECRTARQRGRRRREHAGACEEIEALPAQGTPESIVIARDLEAAALDILSVLKPGDAEALRLAMDDARPPGPTFRKRLERAIARLREAWRTTHGPS